MKKLILPLLALAAALGLTSCFQSETVIHVSKDGSGSVVEETFLGEQVKAMLAQMAALGGDDAKDKDPMAEMFSAEKAKAKAPLLGEGVTFDKVEKIQADGKDGYRVTYKFKDVNKLKLDPGNAAESMKPPGIPEDPDAKKSDPVTFAYADGKLTIHMPRPPKSDKKEEPADDDTKDDGTPDPQEEAMKKMMADMKVAVRVVVDGGIEKTDASHADGNVITLMEMDFSKLVKNPAAFKKLQKAKPETPEEIEKILSGVEGVKMESKETITATLK